MTVVYRYSIKTKDLNRLWKFLYQEGYNPPERFSASEEYSIEVLLCPKIPQVEAEKAVEKP